MPDKTIIQLKDDVTVSQGQTTGVLYVECDGFVATITSAELAAYAIEHRSILY